MRAPLVRLGAARQSEGQHRGMRTANVHWDVFAACSDGERLDSDLYERLHTTIDLAGLYDILEMRDVHASWVDAAVLNAEANAGARP